MQEEARHDRQWMHWPDDREAGMRDRPSCAVRPDGCRRCRRRAHRRPRPGARGTLGGARHAAGALELREARARELHAKVERVLREGSAELDVRQTELEARAVELDVREAALIEAERRVEDRHRELGAVELEEPPSSAVRRFFCLASPSWSSGQGACRSGAPAGHARGDARRRRPPRRSRRRTPPVRCG